MNNFTKFVVVKGLLLGGIYSINTEGEYSGTIDIVTENQWENDCGKYNPNYIDCINFKKEDIMYYTNTLDKARSYIENMINFKSLF